MKTKSSGRLIAGTVLGLLLALGACGGEAEVQGAGKTAGSAKAGVAKGPVKQRTIEVTPKKVAKGKSLYGQCAGCHGAKAEGRIGMAPSLASKSFLEAATDSFLVSTILEGRRETTMAPWEASVGKDGAEAIVAYLRDMTKTEPAKLDNSPLKGDAKNGAKVFQKVCSGCHGRGGGGYMETASGTGIGRKHFLETASNGYLRHIIKQGKSGTPMRPFDEKSKVAVANLKPAEIEDVIAFLRNAAW